jgi:hypothetical protein
MELINEKIKNDKRFKYIDGFKENRKKNNYNLKYYHDNKKEILCSYCNKITCNFYLKQHQKGKNCKIKQQEKKEINII